MTEPKAFKGKAAALIAMGLVFMAWHLWNVVEAPEPPGVITTFELVVSLMMIFSGAAMLANASREARKWFHFAFSAVLIGSTLPELAWQAGSA